jgi:DNA helicase HerA-like ATPase
MNVFYFMNPFDDLDGFFKARLKSSQVKERTYIVREGSITLSSMLGIFEAEFNIKVLNRLEKPCFIASRRCGGNGEVYLIYEVIGVKPVHYQLLSMSPNMPRTLRLDFLEKIDRGWGASEDTWIDIYSVYIGYVMKIKDGDFFFERNETISPLEGADAKLLSIDAVDRLVNVHGGIAVGVMEGFGKELTVSLERLVKYHGGVFGFTGVGKSNITSIIVRKVFEYMPNTRIVIIDTAGEYSIGLLDLILKDGVVYTTEEFNQNVESFLSSQVIPETLLEKISINTLEASIQKLFSKGRIQKVSMEAEGSIEEVIKLLEEEDRAEAKNLALDIKHLLKRHNVPSSTSIRELTGHEIYGEILDRISNCQDELRKLRFPPEKLISKINYIARIVEEAKEKADKHSLTPEALASRLTSPVNNGFEKLTVAYIPDVYDARIFTSRLINKLFSERKRSIQGARVLVVIDEAQEFIPDRVAKEDYTYDVNIAVERLLRQGRKYRLHGWISTQRVAHLNVNAIQQIQSFFTGTLPREYDRRVIAEAAGISPDILDKTAYLDVGEWLFISFRATKLRNIPVFIKAEDNENILSARLKEAV